MKGGYQLINFLGKHLSGDATTVTGVYKALSRSGKAVRIAGLNLSGTMMPEANVNVDLVDDTYIFHVYGYRVEIAPGDQVSISQSDTYDELVEEVSQLNRDLAELPKFVGGIISATIEASGITDISIPAPPNVNQSTLLFCAINEQLAPVDHVTAGNINFLDGNIHIYVTNKLNQEFYPVAIAWFGMNLS